MPKCPHCQSEQSNDVEFCTKCGTRMKGLDKKEEKTDNPDPSYWASPDKTEKDVPEEKKEEIKKDEKDEDDFNISDDDMEDSKDDDLEKDPFEMEFEEDESDNKKSSDGIWLAIIAIVVVVTIVIVGTSKKSSDEEEEENTEEATQEEVIEDETDKKDEVEDSSSESSEEEEVKKEDEKKEDAPKEADLKTYSSSASSTQKDSSGVGFDYSAKQTLDKDFSTAWIEDEKEAGIGEWIEIDFGEEKEINKLGIAPGFARDETIYKENNRVKSFTLEFDGDKKVTLDLDDKYGMQIVEFDKVKTQKVKITIEQVYSGTKYNDTPIAEIDFDSDYVLNNDPGAALEYYNKNKKDQALLPR